MEASDRISATQALLDPATRMVLETVTGATLVPPGRARCASTGTRPQNPRGGSGPGGNTRRTAPHLFERNGAVYHNAPRQTRDAPCSPRLSCRDCTPTAALVMVCSPLPIERRRSGQRLLNRPWSLDFSSAHDFSPGVSTEHPTVG